MPQSADDPSLAEYIRSLALAPDLRDILLALDKRTKPPDHAAEYEEMLARAASLPPPQGPKHKRKRHLRVINGGMGSFAPAVFLGHDATAMRGLAVSFLRWLFCRERRVTHAAAAVLALGLAGAWAVPTVTGPLPHAHAVTCAPRCLRRGEASLTWHHMPAAQPGMRGTMGP